MFIIIEWIDWSGKATQVLLLKEYLEKKSKKVLILDYPRYDRESSYFVKKYLNWDYWKDLSSKQLAMFFAIDRFEDYLEKKDFYKNYDYIISNRYVSASMIHLASKIDDKKEREEFILWLEDLEYNIFNIKKPDKVLFLNVSLETSKKLVSKKQKREYLKNWKDKDLHEEDDNHLEKALDLWIELCKKREDWTNVDCEKDWKLLSFEEVNKKIVNYIWF